MFRKKYCSFILFILLGYNQLHRFPNLTCWIYFRNNKVLVFTDFFVMYSMQKSLTFVVEMSFSLKSYQLLLWKFLNSKSHIWMCAQGQQHFAWPVLRSFHGHPPLATAEDKIGLQLNCKSLCGILVFCIIDGKKKKNYFWKKNS